jgi:hypothetical protein
MKITPLGPDNDDLEPVDFGAATQRRTPAAVVPAPAPAATGDGFFDDEEPKATAKPAAPPKAELGREGPVPPVVQKMRRILGMDETKVVRVPIFLNQDPDPVFTIGLRPISHDDFEWISKRVLQETSQSQPALLQMLWDIALIAMAIASLDEGPLLPSDRATPIWQALGIEPESSAHVRNPYYPHSALRYACAGIMFDELRASMHQFSDTLVTAYRDKVDPTTMVSISKYTAPAPEDKSKKKKGPKENPTTRGS